jgi:hypothetical protein
MALMRDKYPLHIINEMKKILGYWKILSKPIGVKRRISLT